MPKALQTTGLDLTTPVGCASLSSEEFDPADALEVAVRLKALADPVRLLIVSALLTSTTRQLRTCDLAPLVGVGEATVSHHLQQLLNVGLVTKRRDGASVQYCVPTAALAAIARVIAG